MIEQFYRKSHTVKVTFAVSVAVHVALLLISGYSFTESGKDLSRYRAVKLMDIEPETLEIPQGPGLGIEIDDRILCQYTQRRQESVE